MLKYFKLMNMNEINASEIYLVYILKKNRLVKCIGSDQNKYAAPKQTTSKIIMGPE